MSTAMQLSELDWKTVLYLRRRAWRGEPLRREERDLCYAAFRADPARYAEMDYRATEILTKVQQ